MKLICDCGHVVHDEPQIAVGLQSDGKTTIEIETSIGYLIQARKADVPVLVFDLTCSVCKRVFVRFQTVR